MDNVNVFTAFAAGLISFLSPCVLPLVPGYISIISGFSLDQLKLESAKPALTRAVLRNSILFILGFRLLSFLSGRQQLGLGTYCCRR